MSDKIVAVFDVDGTLTDGTFYQSKDGKFLKRFGCDDWDAMKELSKYIQVHIVSADKKGFDISAKRIIDEMGFSLDLVGSKPLERYKWIRNQYPDHEVIYIGDGMYDWYVLENVEYGICPADSLDHVKHAANYVSPRTGARRFVADACFHIMDKFDLCDPWQPGLE